MTHERPTGRQAARRATRRALLDAATDILLERGSPDPVAALRPPEIAAATDRTTGAFYNIWPTQQEFRAALLDHVLALQHFRADPALVTDLAALLDSPAAGPATVFQIMGNAAAAAVDSDPAIPLRLGLWTRHAQDPELRQRLAAVQQENVGAFLPLFETLLRRFRLELSSPYTVHDLSTCVTALAEGLNIRRALDPGWVPDTVGPPPGVPDDGAAWSAFAMFSYVMFQAMTRPATDDRTSSTAHT